MSQKESTSREYAIPDDDVTGPVLRDSARMDGMLDSNRMQGLLDSQINWSSDISKVIDKNLEQYKKDLQSKRGMNKEEDSYNI